MKKKILKIVKLLVVYVLFFLTLLFFSYFMSKSPLLGGIVFVACAAFFLIGVETECKDDEEGMSLDEILHRNQRLEHRNQRLEKLGIEISDLNAAKSAEVLKKGIYGFILIFLFVGYVVVLYEKEEISVEEIIITFVAVGVGLVLLYFVGGIIASVIFGLIYYLSEWFLCPFVDDSEPAKSESHLNHLIEDYDKRVSEGVEIKGIITKLLSIKEYSNDRLKELNSTLDILNDSKNIILDTGDVFRPGFSSMAYDKWRALDNYFSWTPDGESLIGVHGEQSIVVPFGIYMTTTPDGEYRIRKTPKRDGRFKSGYSSSEYDCHKIETRFCCVVSLSGITFCRQSEIKERYNVVDWDAENDKIFKANLLYTYFCNVGDWNKESIERCISSLKAQVAQCDEQIINSQTALRKFQSVKFENTEDFRVLKNQAYECFNKVKEAVEHNARVSKRWYNWNFSILSILAALLFAGTIYTL